MLTLVWQSIFATTEHGTVGVIGSGQGMTRNPDLIKHRYSRHSLNHPVGAWRMNHWLRANNTCSHKRECMNFADSTRCLPTKRIENPSRAYFLFDIEWMSA